MLLVRERNKKTFEDIIWSSNERRLMMNDESLLNNDNNA